MTSLASPALLEQAEHRLDDFMDTLRRVVEIESPTGDVARILAVAKVLVAEIERRGGDVEEVEAEGRGVHLIGRFAGDDASLGPLLIVGHMDTVHPVGTLASMPFEVEDGRLRGPGVYDMKGGLVSVLSGLDLLRERGAGPRRPVTFLVTCDEEVGSQTSQALIERLATESAATLVPEPCIPGGGAKTRRKGAGQYDVDVTGRAAHAGIEPEAGASAVHELARLIPRIVEIADAEIGTTVNVGLVEGGTRSNVVAARARAEVDVRFWTREEAERVDSAIRELEADDGRCTLRVEGGVNRHALERTEESSALYEVARGAAEALGRELDEGGTGGASDGNFTSAVGCPTLDGLGPDGGGAHSVDEHVLVADIPFRMALMASLLASL